MHLNYLHPFCTNYMNRFTSTVKRHSRVFQQLQAEGRRVLCNRDHFLRTSLKSSEDIEYGRVYRTSTDETTPRTRKQDAAVAVAQASSVHTGFVSCGSQPQLVPRVSDTSPFA